MSLLATHAVLKHTFSRASSPDFDSPNERFGYPFGLIVYYSWNFLATIILVNVLIALFGSAYSDVEENATDEYLAFFAHKTISLSEWPAKLANPQGILYKGNMTESCS
jgi:hypothetical protein